MSVVVQRLQYWPLQVPGSSLAHDWILGTQGMWFGRPGSTHIERREKEGEHESSATKT
jgi:hypothetical protein